MDYAQVAKFLEKGSGKKTNQQTKWNGKEKDKIVIYSCTGSKLVIVYKLLKLGATNCLNHCNEEKCRKKNQSQYNN
uniref:Uncharacterized protein n=1 Tax=Rhizophora mucronata TaxID=61149 RepID=A0A2P2IMK1_RHIMU